MDKGYEFLGQHRRCVVKPADGTGGGDGVTTGIETRRQLLRAAVAAAGFSPELLIEEEVEGNTVRLLYLDGKLLDAVQRNSPAVVGDGSSKIRDLVKSTRSASFPSSCSGRSDYRDWRQPSSSLMAVTAG